MTQPLGVAEHKLGELLNNLLPSEKDLERIIDTYHSDEEGPNGTSDRASDRTSDGASDKRSNAIAGDIVSILSQVAITWKKPAEIAEAIGKSEQTTKRRIIPSLLKEGILVKEFPDSPTHPAQRYRIVKFKN